MTLSPLSAAILATLLMYLLTALGAALVFPLRRFHPRRDEPADGARCGHHARRVVLSLPAARADVRAFPPAKPLLMCSGGFLLGGLLVLLADTLLSRRMRRTPLSDVRRRTVLLIGSITLHNIPEGFGGRLRVRCFGVPPAGRRGAARGCLPSALRCKTSLKGQRSVCRSAATVIPAAVRSSSDSYPAQSNRLRGFWAHCWRFASAPPCRCCFRSPAGAMVTVILAELLPGNAKNARGSV